MSLLIFRGIIVDNGTSSCSPLGSTSSHSSKVLGLSSVIPFPPRFAWNIKGIRFVSSESSWHDKGYQNKSRNDKKPWTSLQSLDFLSLGKVSLVKEDKQ